MLRSISIRSRLTAQVLVPLKQIKAASDMQGIATGQQTQVANEIHGNITHFSMGLSDVAGSAHQSALPCEEIARLSADLQQQVSTFRV